MELPILERADELIAAIAAHQVVIVAGGTGSGKSNVNGIKRRLDKLPENPAKDLHKLAEVRSVEREYSSLLESLPPGDVDQEVVDLGWMLEELRICTFAPSLGTSRPVSTKRVIAELVALRG